ncbi:hypothetical protein [Marisediminicola senii]|uniref:hypothetical protein n=1 Tax=Marisediminicola senii TaxID=2711233 RepID=UPI0013EDC521|nr:hypothetical protein [Marisediminicola senii]
MSDASSPALPPAAVEVTDYRRRLDASASRAPIVAIGLVAFAVASVALVATLSLVGPDWFPAEEGIALLVAMGIAGVGVLLALCVILPAQLVRRDLRRRVDDVEGALTAAAAQLRSHLASIGYEIPVSVALDWVASPQATATVPLVHDSVIAARWWRPGEGDDRVFVEPYLQQGDEASALPVLPPLATAP